MIFLLNLQKRSIYDHINDMVNFSIVDLQGKDPRCNVMFHDENGQKLFYILLTDFLSETDKNGLIDKTTFLNGLLKISANPQFSIRSSEKELVNYTEDFIKWVGEEKKYNIWMPSLEKNVTIFISRIDAIKICGNLTKHNDLRVFGIIKKFKEIMNKSDFVITEKECIAALKDFCNMFQNNVLGYLSSYICEFLNNIRWGIHRYLQPEFNRSYYKLDPDLPNYNYKIPEMIKCEYARYCYWELMNILRRKPIMKKFIVSQSLKCEY